MGRALVVRPFVIKARARLQHYLRNVSDDGLAGVGHHAGK